MNPNLFYHVDQKFKWLASYKHKKGSNYIVLIHLDRISRVFGNLVSEMHLFAGIVRWIWWFQLGVFFKKCPPIFVHDCQN